MIARASDSVSDPLVINTVSFLPKLLPLFKQNNRSFGHEISLGNVMLCPKDRHPLLVECLITSLRYMRMVGQDSGTGSVSSPLIVNIDSFLLKKHSFCKQNNQFWAPDQPRNCDVVT